MDFGSLPPEINSTRLYSGSGSSSLQAAASAWSALAAELNSVATSYGKVLAELTAEAWRGPASAAMAEAAAPYVAWICTTASHAEQSAAKARAAAAAFDQAFASIVPPPVVATNRVKTSQLISANIVGQFTATIAQLEADYADMWAHDAAVMYTYAGHSAVAAKVSQFKSPTSTTNPAGQQTQAAAVAQATATGTQSTLQKLTSQVPLSLHSLASPAAATASSTTSTNPLAELWYLLTGQSSTPSSAEDVLDGYSPYSSLFYNTEGLPYFSVGLANFGASIAKNTGLFASSGGAAASAAAGGGAAAAADYFPLGAQLTRAVPSISAGLGSAPLVGQLSVPAAWPGSAPAPAPFNAPVPVSTVSAVSESAAGPGNMFGGMPMAGAGGAQGAGHRPKYGFKPAMVARPPSAG